ncbi:related to cytochrome P450 CYP2 subfamily [Rhynchosporium agropyri]|uniref:Related to cytochrome P450 CYP2 subfamily n=1 Tax=Rhynchosporium agropyri TaxID=914238 RepID=A0A1E1LBL2_9HELO|nr:related to cytochrome P450 CYP2 subfamily [Rhynchosporium agropyri]
MFGDVFGDNTSVASLPYGDRWALHRKLLYHSLKGPALPASKPRQEAEALALTTSIVNESNDWSQGLDRCASSVVFSMAYGGRIASLDSNVLKTRQEFFRYASDLLKPGAYLMEMFGFLLQLPSFLTRWKDPVLQMGRDQAAFDIGLVNTAEVDSDANALSDTHFAAVPASLFGAGSYTTASTLHFVVLGLLTQPDMQKLAQAELDAIVGNDRSLTYADQAEVPFIDAIIKEVLRWRPSAVFGMPHATSETDVYKSYHFQKGTVVWASSWGVNQNPGFFPSPQTFAPNRSLDTSDPRYDANVAAKPFPGVSHDHATFGFGRRACAGAELATNKFFIVIAKLLWSFDIKPIEGEIYDIDAFTGGLVLRPAPFKCRFVIRDEGRRLVLEREMKKAEEVLPLFPAFD